MLAQAKNGDQVFGKEKFHAANGKAQACSQGALIFFFFCFGVGGEFLFIFLIFPMCLHYVPVKFPMGSEYVPRFRNVPLSPYHLSFIPHALENGVLPSPI